MKVTPLSIPDVLLIEPQVFGDDRGFFFESFNQECFEKILGRKINFVQDNHSKSVKGVLRGLHYQKNPFEQGKLVRVIKGSVFDVAVDLRKESLFFGQWVGEFLSEENKKQLWIPKGFAHGFLAMFDNVEFLYKVTDFYKPNYEIAIKWDDPDLAISWPDSKKLISNKDQCAISFDDFKKLNLT
jgi:dTDP-4-dehydrorhamnose 3,5-epimerase